MNRSKYSKFTSQRRNQLIAECVENNLTSTDLFERHQDELKSYGVNSRDVLHEILYAKSGKILKELNLYIQHRDTLKKTSPEKFAKAERFMDQTYGAMGFNYKTRTTKYESIKRSSSADSFDLADMLSSLGMLES